MDGKHFRCEDVCMSIVPIHSHNGNAVGEDAVEAVDSLNEGGEAAV